ncbi:MAG: porin [Gemmatimonadales bacterium]
MHARHLHTLMAAAALGVALAPAADAQAPNVRVSGRMQAQYRLSSGDSSGNYNAAQMSNGFEIRRLRIQTDVRFGDNLLVVIQPSFENGSLRMRDAFLRVGLSPQFGVTIGQEKSPFQRYELNSSNNLPSIERGVRILRLSGREGLNDVLAVNGYASHDLGAFVDWAAPESKVTVKVGVQNGSRESTADVNNAKSFFGRATAIVVTNAANQPVLQVGGSFGARDRAICPPPCTTVAYVADSSKTTTAFGLDLEWGGFRPGWHVIADFATGDNVPPANRVSASSSRNTANLRTTADSVLRTFLGFSVIGAYRLNTAGPDTRLVKTLEPALRLDYLDPDTDTDDDQGLLITPALNIYFANTVVLRAGFDFYSYKDAAGASRSARELKFSWQANF